MVFKLKPRKIFYGWWITGASFLTALYVGGAVFYGFTAFFEPIADEMGWSYTQISLAASLRGLEIGLLAPLVGVLADRWGPKRLIFSGAIITAAGLLLLGAAKSLAMFYGAFALIAVGISGCTLTVLMTAIANWFRRKIGLASGIAISGFGSSGLLIPAIVRCIELYGWRMSANILALGAVVVILPLSFLFRRKPEQYGYYPDGQRQSSATYPDDSGQSQAADIEVKTKQALKSGAFWRLAISFWYHMLVMSAVVTHVMPYLSSVGIKRATASLVATAIPLMSILGRLGLGWLGDKSNRKLMAAASYIMMGCGVLCFGYASATSMWLLVPFLIIFGIGYGGSNSLRPSLSREYFGRTSFGTIFGLIVGIGGIGSIIGPTIAGWTYDNLGSYQVTWLVFAGLALVAIISILTITPVSNISERRKQNYENLPN